MRTIRFRDVADIVAEVVPGCSVEFGEEASADARCYRVNCDRARNELPGYEPTWDVRRGAEQIYNTIKQSGLTLAQFEGPQYLRIAHVRMLLGAGLLDQTLRFRHSMEAAA